MGILTSSSPTRTRQPHLHYQQEENFAMQSNTFQEYVNIVSAPYISSQLEKVHRLDLVWDVYQPDSLKGTTRQKRGVRKRLAPSTVMPKNWKDFLRFDQNKTEIFRGLFREDIRLPIADGKEMYATCGTEVRCSPAESDFAASPNVHTRRRTLTCFYWPYALWILMLCYCLWLLSTTLILTSCG